MAQLQQHTFSQLSQEERVEIYTFLREGVSLREISRRLQRHHTTISREVSRNSKDFGRGKTLYKPLQAQERYLLRKRKANLWHIKLRKDHRLRTKIYQLLNDTALWWWPDEILWRLQQEWRNVVSTPTLYRYIHTHWRGILLLHKEKGYRKRYSKETRGRIDDGIACISERDPQIGLRKTLGDREADTVLSRDRSSWLVTLVERKSRYLLIGRVKMHESKHVCWLLHRLLAGEQVSTLTTDNGKEFARLGGVQSKLGIICYRTHPYASYEKWTNERTNGLIRRYLPKGCDMSKYSEKEIENIRDRLNHKPRKILGYRTPYEVYHNSYLSYIT